MIAAPARTLPELRGMFLPELEDLAERLGEPRYRGRQIARWLYAHGAETVDGHRRRQAVNVVDVGFLHQAQELTRVG
jgi:adenine C2-methylase RlmN of 23S rRNA A2503 and tRNA A37